MALPADLWCRQGFEGVSQTTPVAERFRRIFHPSVTTLVGAQALHRRSPVHQSTALLGRDGRCGALRDLRRSPQACCGRLGRLRRGVLYAAAHHSRHGRSRAAANRRTSSTILASGPQVSSPKPQQYIRRHARALSGKDLDTLNELTFFGVELKPLTYLLGIMNMLLHRIVERIWNRRTRSRSSTPPICPRKTNTTLSSRIHRTGESCRRSCRPISRSDLARRRSSSFSTSWRVSRKAGAPAVIVPEGVCFAAAQTLKVRERFSRSSTSTRFSRSQRDVPPIHRRKDQRAVLQRRQDGKGTQDVWFFEVTNDGFELTGSRKPIEGEQISTFVSLFKHRSRTERSWLVPIEELRASSWDLSARNPSTSEGYEHRAPAELARELLQKEERVIEIFRELQELLAEGPGAVES